MSFIQLQRAPSRKDGRAFTYVNLAVSVRPPGSRHPHQERVYLGCLLEDGKTVAVSKRFAAGTGVTVSLEELKSQAKDGKDVAAWLEGHCRRSVVVSSAPLAVTVSDLKAVETVGQVHLLASVAEDLKLPSCLEQAFGAQEGAALLTLAMHQTAESRPLYLAESWTEGAALSKVARDFDYSSANLSRFMARLGQDPRSLEEFFRRWTEARGRPSSLIFDTTSISTQAAQLSLAEWGYNRDGDSLPQVNLALVSAREEGLPLFYRLIPGSVPDVTLLRNTVSLLQDFGVKEFTSILDRGFYSAGNVRSLLAEGLGFALGVPFSVQQARNLVRRHRNALGSVKRSFLFHGRLVRHVADRWQVDLGQGERREIRAHVFLDPEKRAETAASLERHVLEIEALANTEIAEKRIENLAEAREWLRQRAGMLYACFTLRRSAEGLRVARRPHPIAMSTALKGFSVILTDNLDAQGADVLADYRARDAIEKLFDIFKNENGQHRLRSGRDDITAGRVFLAFLALIIHQALENRLRKADLLKRFTVAEVLAQMRKVKVVHTSSGQRLLLEITKKQRELLKAMGVPMPS